MQTNAADPRQIREAKQTSREIRKQELKDVGLILSTIEGRRFFFRYLCECGIFKTSFTGSSETFFREGQRNVGLSLLADLNDADPTMYAKIMEENRKVNE
jgi:hypothetical protein